MRTHQQETPSTLQDPQTNPGPTMRSAFRPGLPVGKKPALVPRQDSGQPVLILVVDMPLLWRRCPATRTQSAVADRTFEDRHITYGSTMDEWIKGLRTSPKKKKRPVTGDKIGGIVSYDAFSHFAAHVPHVTYTAVQMWPKLCQTGTEQTCRFHGTGQMYPNATPLRPAKC